MKSDDMTVQGYTPVDKKKWSETFQRMVLHSFKSRGAEILQKYQNVFSELYQSLMPARYAISDIYAIEKMLVSMQFEVILLNPGRYKNHYRLHFYTLEPRCLDEYFPVLGNLNLRVIDQIQFPLQVQGKPVFIKSFTIEANASQCDSFTILRCRLLKMIKQVLNGKIENDSLNSLLVLTGLSWQQIDLLRAYRNYFLQLSYKTTVDSFHHALISNPQVALYLFKYFDARFNPETEWEDNLQREEQALFPLRIKLLETIETVVDINHDRVLRILFNLIDATVRSNYHLRCQLDEFFIAFKINSLGIIDMPNPRPQNEIYVHAVDMEGIHLRGGKISRGGIRWSDRVDDFRTEILGLMQTQMSKNVLIIPKGAKGGFIVKHDCKDDRFREAGKKAYIRFIQGLLDLTDNFSENQSVMLPGIVRYDDDDPYLVVAADKGTAQFSDLANKVAADYKFWLADAFASGGSNGYNHKKLGITARGAWESVKRHFRELGKDIQNQPFTVVGIGSMDGDVFGNGMLLSPFTQLLAAFSGEHIFIDPQPENLNRSFMERKRLYGLPGSSWADYNPELISAGGGVFRRDAKNIPVSQVIKNWLGIRYNTIDGETLIQYLLKASVELLWLGGIGTYVKSSEETHSAAGDRSNDSVRIDANSLKAQVIGEGANLGFTQKARIEYALAGGKINTDAIDNSAGVDISDHEVNVKILLRSLCEKQKIQEGSQLFHQLTEMICQSVLSNNYQHTLCLSLEERRCSAQIKNYLQIADQLQTSHFLDKEAESFSTAKLILSRQTPVLTRPELAVIMAASKMFLTQKLIEQASLLQADFFDYYLYSYFPKPLTKQYADDVAKHPLAKEIKATVISNKIINQAGCLFLLLNTDNEKGLLESCFTYLAFNRILQADKIRKQIFELDNKCSADQQYHLLQEIENTLLGFCRWVLVNQVNFFPSEQIISSYQNYLDGYRKIYLQNLTEDQSTIDRVDELYQIIFSKPLAEQICFIQDLTDFPYLVNLTMETGESFASIVQLFSEFNLYLGLDKIYSRFKAMSPHDYWEERVTLELKNEIMHLLCSAIKQTLKKGASCDDFFTNSEKMDVLQQYRLIYQKLDRESTTELMPYIALKQILAKLLG